MYYTIPFHKVGVEAPASLVKMIRALGVDVPNATGWLDSQSVQEALGYDSWFHVVEACKCDTETCEHFPHGLG